MRSLTRLIATFACTGLFAFTLCAPAYAKRTPPPKVPPLVVGEIEFRVAHEKFSAADKPAGLHAYVVAENVKTRKELWKAEVYTIDYKPDLETDVQDVFIKSLAAEGKLLVVTNEKGTVFHLDPETKKVTPAK